MQRELKHCLLGILSLAIAIPATWVIDKRMNRTIVAPPEPEAAHAAAMRVLDNWATYPGLYEDARLLAAHVEVEYSDTPVDADWLRLEFGDPATIGKCEQWNMPPMHARLYPDGSIVVWRSHVILDAPTRGQLFRGMRIRNEK